LVVSVELCSLTFQPRDVSWQNVVAAMLFDDAAAAVVVTDRGGWPGPAVLASRTHLFPDTIDYMGFVLKDFGLHLVMSPEVPEMVRRAYRPLLEDFLKTQSLRTERDAAERVGAGEWDALADRGVFCRGKWGTGSRPLRAALLAGPAPSEHGGQLAPPPGGLPAPAPLAAPRSISRIQSQAPPASSPGEIRASLLVTCFGRVYREDGMLGGVEDELLEAGLGCHVKVVLNHFR